MLFSMNQTPTDKTLQKLLNKSNDEKNKNYDVKQFAFV